MNKPIGSKTITIISSILIIASFFLPTIFALIFLPCSFVGGLLSIFIAKKENSKIGIILGILVALITVGAFYPFLFIVGSGFGGRSILL